MLKVSCVMPAYYGDIAKIAIQCFLNQTYENRELIVVDNNPNDKKIQHLLPINDPRIVYIQCEKRPVGALRNLGTLHATGEICVTCDCDDWFADNRIQAQVDRLAQTGKAVTGWHNILFFDTDNEECFKFYHDLFVHPPSEFYACGTSQMYLKSWWKEHPFVSTGIEDQPFMKEASEVGQLDSCDAEQLCVVRAHIDSVCPIVKYVNRDKQFVRVNEEDLPQEFWRMERGK